MTRSKERRRCDRLVDCVQRNDIKQLKYYVKRKKYSKLKLEKIVVNRRQESLLLLASRLSKSEVVQFLLQHSLYDPSTRDSKGNSALHLALKAIMKIQDKDEFITVYRNLILPLLHHIPVSMEAKNNEGQTIEALLDIADTAYQHYTTQSSSTRNRENIQQEELEWQRKLAGEMEDEYERNWGQYEADFLEETKESEDYDAWAERILHERRQKHTKVPSATKKEKVQWTDEDQRLFLEEEEKKRQQVKIIQREQIRMQFCSKLLRMAQITDGIIRETDLPFALTDDAIAICDIIVMEVEKLSEDPKAQRKAHRDLQRLWHPDKFAQKFGSLLADDIRSRVLTKITEISQTLNVYVCKF